MTRCSGRRCVTAAISALLCVLCVLCHGEGTEKGAKNVLLLFSSIEMENTWMKPTEDMIRARVPGPINFYVSHLFSIPPLSNREIGPVFEASLGSQAETFRRQYSVANLNLVLAFAPQAFLFVSQYRDRMFPGVPIVFTQLGTREYGGRNWPPDITGLMSDVGIGETIDLALRLHPDTQTVAVISSADKFWLGVTHAEILRHNVRDTYLTSPSFGELHRQVEALPPHTVVLFHLGQNMGSDYGRVDLLADVTKRFPTYTAWPKTCLGQGCIGGAYGDESRQTKETADLAARVLSGERPKVQEERSLQARVDWRELQHWHIPESALPQGTLVLYREPTLWERYWNYILAIVAVILIQALAIGGLLIQRYRRRRAEGSLREMTGRLLQTQDEERRRVARELHDGTGQDLAGIALGLGQVLADFPPGFERLRQLLQDSHTTSKLALDEVRAISYALHPPMLDGLGLVPALRLYLDGLQKRTTLRIDFEGPNDSTDAAPDIQRALFRVVQESVTNVLRHAGGTALKVSLADDGKGIRLKIEDNGRGMSAEELRRVRGTAAIGVGIAGMRERVQQLHGTFDINSNTHGTRVSVSLPIEEDKHAAHSAG